MDKRYRVGIVGLGSFGSFLRGLIPESIEVVTCDPATPGVSGVIEDLAGVDMIFLAIPLASYPDVLSKIKLIIKPETLLVDLCSVKQIPERYFDEYFPTHTELLITHPLFGPQSASSSTRGHKLVVTRAEGKLYKIVLDFCENKLGLNIIRMSPVEHDKAMAKIHALTFFVARAINKLDLHLEYPDLLTPSYSMLVNLANFDSTHSDDLFKTIENGNSYATDIRSSFINKLIEVDSLLSDKDKKEI